MRRPSWPTVLLALAGALLVGLIALYLYAVRAQVHGYYQAVLAPERLGPHEGAAPPPAARLTDVPMIQSDLELSHAVALMMLAAQQGRDESRQLVSFSMGDTWGASEVPRQEGFLPGQDPEVGLRRGANALGFRCRYFVTDDPERYLLELRAQLAAGRAARVVVDRTTLEKRRNEQPEAHSIVLIGYDGTGFEYYEPTCRADAHCEPGTRAPGEKGQTTSTQGLLAAVDQQALVYKYPWTYQLLVLEKADLPPEPPFEALHRNARALVGFKRAELSSGAEAIDEAAKNVSRAGREAFTSRLERSVRLAALVRRDDARTLGLLFPGDPTVEAGAVELERAADAYARAAATFERKNNVFALNDALVAAAAADRAAGQALLHAGPDAGTP